MLQGQASVGKSNSQEENDNTSIGKCVNLQIDRRKEERKYMLGLIIMFAHDFNKAMSAKIH